MLGLEAGSGKGAGWNVFCLTFLTMPERTAGTFLSPFFHHEILLPAENYLLKRLPVLRSMQPWTVLFFYSVGLVSSVVAVGLPGHIRVHHRAAACGTPWAVVLQRRDIPAVLVRDFATVTDLPGALPPCCCHSRLLDAWSSCCEPGHADLPVWPPATYCEGAHTTVRGTLLRFIWMLAGLIPGAVWPCAGSVYSLPVLPLPFAKHRYRSTARITPLLPSTFIHGRACFAVYLLHLCLAAGYADACVRRTPSGGICLRATNCLYALRLLHALPGVLGTVPSSLLFVLILNTHTGFPVLFFCSRSQRRRWRKPRMGFTGGILAG